MYQLNNLSVLTGKDVQKIVADKQICENCDNPAMSGTKICGRCHDYWEKHKFDV